MTVRGFDGRRLSLSLREIPEPQLRDTQLFLRRDSNLRIRLIPEPVAKRSEH
jgi:hypothetical protein